MEIEKNKKYGMWTVIRCDVGPRKNQIKYFCRCDCGNERFVTKKVLSNESKPRSCGCFKKKKSREFFESKIKKTESCWIWMGSKNQGGYGKIGKNKLAHRIAYQYYIGPIEKSKQVCHSCDVRNCVNPAHLFLGSIGDNMRDRTRKNRQAKGSRIKSSILNEDKVLEIRKMRLSGKTYEEISNEFGYKWDSVRRICKKEGWKHVPLADECRSMKQIRIVLSGEKSRNSKLKQNEVFEIRDFYKKGISAKILSERFNVQLPTIYDIVKERTWKHLLEKNQRNL